MKIINSTLNSVLKGMFLKPKIKILILFELFEFRMSPILSTIVTTCLIILFFSFLSARIDQSTNWKWFVIFIPLFILQTFYLIDAIFLIVKNRFTLNIKLIKLITFFFSIILVFTFEILVCIRLDYLVSSLKLGYILIPAWILMIIQMIYLLIKLTN